MKINIKKIYNYSIGIASVLGAFYLIYVLFASVIPFDILNVKNGNSVTVLNENKIVKRGDVLNLKMDYCKNLPFQGTLNTYIIDGLKQELPETEGTLDVGCRTVLFYIRIPTELTAGTGYRIERVSNYKVSPFTTVKETWKTEPFEITN